MQSDVGTTPESRLGLEQEVSDRVKRRVRDADPNHGRCLVENVEESRAVEFCHCVPRSFKKHEAVVCVYIIDSL